MMGFREDEKKARAAFSKFELIHIGISPSGQQNVALHHDVHAKESKNTCKISHHLETVNALP